MHSEAHTANLVNQYSNPISIIPQAIEYNPSASTRQPSKTEVRSVQYSLSPYPIPHPAHPMKSTAFRVRA
ncbi:hypothetical protein BC830DRAFT_1148052 [Chytriomyces sp. MP71]|nr:hypothetical protein BC830DRAFT_1148052 [Chytriomyces sp. MP71]